MTGDAPLRAAALFPHGNVRALVNKERAVLLKKGFFGAYFFPAAAPVAVLNRPLLRAELKHAALALRSGLNASPCRKITSRGCAFVKLPLGASSFYIYGPRLILPPRFLDAAAGAFPLDAVAFRPAEIVLALSSFEGEGDWTCGIEPVFSAPDFSVCALANMIIQPVSGTLSSAWGAGRPAWIPGKQ